MNTPALLKPRIPALLTRYRSIIGRGTWAVAGQVASVTFTLGGTRLITQYLDPGLYGAVNLVQNGVLLLRTLFCSPILSAGVRFYPEAERGHYLAAFRSHLSRNLFRALIAVEVLAVIGALFSIRRLGATPFIVVAIAVYAAADFARTLELTLLGAAQRQRPVAFLSALEALARPILIVLGVVLLGASIAVVLGAMAGSIIVTLLALYFTRRRRGTRAERSDNSMPLAIVDEMKRFTMPLIPVAALNWATQLSDRYIIDWLTHDTASIGVYAAGYGVTSAPLMIINGLVLMVLRPVYFTAQSHRDHAKAERTFRIWLISTALCCLIAACSMFAARGFIVSILLGPQYRGAIAVIPWIAFGYVCYAIEQVLEQKMMAQKRSHAVLIAQSAGAAASIIVTIPLVMRFGMMGAAYACPIYFSIQCAVALCMLRAPGTDAAEPSKIDAPI